MEIKIMSNHKFDIYATITDKILHIMKEGVVPWQKPWLMSGSHRNLVSGAQYRGINVFLLSCSSFGSPWWLTFKQAKEKGGKIRKGEKGTIIVFWKPILIKDVNSATGEEEKKRRFVLRYYKIFNLEQVDGIEAPPEPEKIVREPIETAATIIQEMQNQPTIKHGASYDACYRPSSDEVIMPLIDDFESSEAYYSVLFHEVGHSTGHESRVSRPEGMKNICFGSDSYSKEELIAEMTAAFLCGESGILKETIQQSASYIESWSAKFKDDTRMVICAAAAAQKATDYILNRKFTDSE
jgi:antirestriction protein ArdC